MLSSDDVQQILNAHDGNVIFAQALDQIADPSSLLKMMSQFIEFNSVFAAGVANLAGQVACRKEFFRDKNDKIDVLADRSCDIAALIYFAAIDEFDRKKTHRSTAQNTLHAMSQFLGYDNNKINKLTDIVNNTRRTTEKVRQGYCLSRKPAASDLFKGIGFHIGSEILAVEEFRILDSYLHTKHPAMVKYLQSSDSYQWIAVHPIVEEDHFQAALEAANLALQYYKHNGQPKTWILEGLTNFAAVQTEFMSSLSRLISIRPD